MLVMAPISLGSDGSTSLPDSSKSFTLTGDSLFSLLPVSMDFCLKINQMIHGINRILNISTMPVSKPDYALQENILVGCEPPACQPTSQPNMEGADGSLYRKARIVTEVDGPRLGQEVLYSEVEFEQF